MNLFHIIIICIISFTTTFWLVPKWIKKAHIGKIIGSDLNKFHKPKVAELGGLPVIGGILVSTLLYILITIFVYNQEQTIMEISVIILSLLIATVIGLVDDLLGWKIGLRARYKILATFLIAFPIIAINKTSIINLPIFGEINFNLFYPFFLIPLAIVGASNGFNMIAGYNGLEAGNGFIILSTLSYLTFMKGNFQLAVIALLTVASLLAFIYFNRYPARIFPGNILTYSVGSLIAIIAILGKLEKYALILFIPYFLELIFKARGKMKKESFAKVNSDGSLERPYQKYYGLEHISIDIVKKVYGNASEKKVVQSLWRFQLLFSLMSIIYFTL